MCICAICGRHHCSLRCSPADAIDFSSFGLRIFLILLKLCRYRRLWRLAVATQPTIAEQPVSAVSRGDTYLSETHCKLRRSAAVGYHLTLSWFRKAGPTIILNIIVDASVHLLGTIFRWRCRIDPQLRCFAACSGFHDIGPAPRNPQLILNLLPFVGAWLRRDAIASYVSFFCSSPHATSV